jgi:hypothetical protein
MRPKKAPELNRENLKKPIRKLNSYLLTWYLLGTGEWIRRHALNSPFNFRQFALISKCSNRLIEHFSLRSRSVSMKQFFFYLELFGYREETVQFFESIGLKKSEDFNEIFEYLGEPLHLNDFLDSPRIVDQNNTKNLTPDSED